MTRTLQNNFVFHTKVFVHKYLQNNFVLITKYFVIVTNYFLQCTLYIFRRNTDERDRATDPFTAQLIEWLHGTRWFLELEV